MYYIYHIEGKKVGCTNNPFKRITQQQGYYDYEILYKTNCIDKASAMELQWQTKLGYKKDIRTYKETINNLKTKKMIHVTNQTITFKKTFNNKLDGFKFPSFIEVEDYIIEVNNEIKDFLINNNFKSKHSEERYVYIQSLKNFWDVVSKPKNNIDIFNNIRQWAKERGIYEKGDTRTQYVKLMEEAGELAQAILKEDTNKIEDAIGDIVVVLTNLAHLQAMKIEDCIESAYEEIKNRKGKMQNGTFVKNK